METNIKAWYMNAYPTDNLGNWINGELTFGGLFEALDHLEDVYKVIGVYDSIVRERLFGRLAAIMDVDYDEIYDQWLQAGEVRLMEGE